MEDLEKEEIIVKKFGLHPSQNDYEEIKTLFLDEIKNRKKLKTLSLEEIKNLGEEEGCGDYLRTLCFMIFYLGHVEDCISIWEAKSIDMDTFCYIDVGLTCGGGYDETIKYISDKPKLAKMKSYLEECFALEESDGFEQFDRERLIKSFENFYRNTF